MPAQYPRQASIDDQELFNDLKAVFASLSDEELDALADDLDFCRFTGLPSARVKAMMVQVESLAAEAAGGSTYAA